MLWVAILREEVVGGGLAPYVAGRAGWGASATGGRVYPAESGETAGTRWGGGGGRFATRGRRPPIARGGRLVG
jgi:hypothetical protein